MPFLLASINHLSANEPDEEERIEEASTFLSVILSSDELKRVRKVIVVDTEKIRFTWRG